MKIYDNKFLKTLLFSVLFAGSCIYLLSCSEDDEGLASALPVISKVRITDPSAVDSTFNRSFRGQLLVIEGSNFEGVNEIRMNGIAVAYNSNYLTPTSIIVSIPGNLPFQGEDASLPNTIEVVNNVGAGSFDFIFLAPEPGLSLFKFAPPLTAGETMEILGFNFYNIEKVVFSAGGTTMAEVTTFDVNEDFDVLSFTIPGGIDQDGEITIIAESGEVSDDFLLNPVPQFTKLSDDIQAAGAPITITGKFFEFIEKVVFPGGVEVPAEDITFNDLNTEMEVIVPDGVSGFGKVELHTAFDVIESPINFNDFSGVMIDWDGKGWDWGKGAVESADGSEAPFVGTGNYLHMNMMVQGSDEGWLDPLTLAVNFGAWPGITDIVDDTPISEMAMAFNFYTKEPFDKGYWRLQFGQGGGNGGTLQFKPYETAPVEQFKWTTFTVPLTEIISNPGILTYADLKGINPGAVPFFIQFGNDSPDPIAVNMYWDNVRLVKLP